MKSSLHLFLFLFFLCISFSLSTLSVSEDTTSTTTGKTTIVPEELDCDSDWGCEDQASLLIFSFLIIACGSVMVVYFVVVRRLTYLPESVAVVIYGVIVGVILRFIQDKVVEHVREFDAEKFFLFILPVIIFETGYSLNKTPFFSNIGTILAFAMIGTCISFGVVGGLLYAVGKAGLSTPLSLWESMVFGSLLSATDPVATLAIFQSLNVDQTLYMVVLGESILNDAVALILYRASYYYAPGQMFQTIASFFIVNFGSTILGVIVAVVLSGIFRIVNFSRFPPLETIFMVAFSYMSYVLANGLHLSGILSVFWCGIAFNHYGSYSLSPYTTLTSRQVFRTAAFICETIVFLYIGVSLATVNYVYDLPLILWTIFFCLLARALHVFPLSFLINRFKRRKLSWQMQIAIWFAGLRGAIAFSLSLAVEAANAAYIRSTTLVFVHFTLFVMGMGTRPLLKLLGIKSASDDQSLDHITKPREKTPKPRSTTRAANFIADLDENHFKKWFRRPVQPLAQEALEAFERLASGTTFESAHERESQRVRSLPDQHHDKKVSGYSSVVGDEGLISTSVVDHNEPDDHHNHDHNDEHEHGDNQNDGHAIVKGSVIEMQEVALHDSPEIDHDKISLLNKS